MKRVSFCVLLMIFLAAQVSATNVPPLVTKAFAQKYPKVEDVSWNNSGGIFVADFYDAKEGFFKAASFDGAGTWMSTQTDLDASNLPDAILVQLEKQFESLDDLDSIKKEETPESIQYFISMDNGEEYIMLIFDQEGNLIN